jgi:ectoine hydroxylase-related dioxygenase (phytanoyl-CoA dioxygenase family)
MSERFGPIDFDEFHLVDLPARLASGNGALARVDLEGVRPLAFRLEDGRSYTYTVTDDGIAVTPGDGKARTIVELAYQDWCEFVWELRSCFALFYADRIAIPLGSFGHFARWEPALRAAYDGQPIYELDDPLPLLGRGGKPLDLQRTFTLDDDDDEIRDFLHRAGYVHLRGVFAPEEIAELSEQIDAAIALARPDDARSWWTTVEGKDVCNRVNYLNDDCPRVAELDVDSRLQRIGALGGAELRVASDRLDGNGVVIKVAGAEIGLADLPWHRDCGMGGHPVKCPMLNIGIQLDPATPQSGQLQMIAGSHRGTSRLPTDVQAKQLPVVAITTEPGDVTVHWGHTLHASPPPTSKRVRGRRALYVSYVPPLTFEMMGPREGYNDVLFTRDAGHVRHIDELSPKS